MPPGSGRRGRRELGLQVDVHGARDVAGAVLVVTVGHTERPPDVEDDGAPLGRVRSPADLEVRRQRGDIDQNTFPHAASPASSFGSSGVTGASWTASASARSRRIVYASMSSGW